jgi:thiol-disulfide isomerase/thioredoxin
LRFGGILVLATMMAMSSWRRGAAVARRQGCAGLRIEGAGRKEPALSEFRGQVVLVNFWARWAGDSRKEMPALDRINTTYNAPASSCSACRSTTICAAPANSRFDGRILSRFCSTPSGSIGRDYMIQKMPMTFLVDRAGVVRLSTSASSAAMSALISIKYANCYANKR